MCAPSHLRFAQVASREVRSFLRGSANGEFIVEESPLTDHMCTWQKVPLKASSIKRFAHKYQPACGWACQINIELALSKLQSWRDPSNIAYSSSLFMVNRYTSAFRKRFLLLRSFPIVVQLITWNFDYYFIIIPSLEWLKYLEQK